MTQTASVSSPRAKAYFSLTKPGIIMGNVITAASGFALASKEHFNGNLFLCAMLGLALIIASACAFNNYIDRAADQKMVRTQNRALARGEIALKSALIFAAALGLLGTFLLLFFVNGLTTAIALFGFTAYVFAYSFLKYRTSYATLVGSFAGAVPPVVGYTAVSNHIDAAAWILFALIVFWQMPHFYAIAIYRQGEYAKASIPVLPIAKGMRATKLQMLFYTIAFAVTSSLLFLCGYVGLGYFLIALCLGISWIALCIKGFKSENDHRWARKMFLFSLIVVTALSAAMFIVK